MKQKLCIFSVILFVCFVFFFVCLFVFFYKTLQCLRMAMISLMTFSTEKLNLSLIHHTHSVAHNIQFA